MIPSKLQHGLGCVSLSAIDRWVSGRSRQLHLQERTQPMTAVGNVLARTGPRKMLALDGGGILGVISLGFLARIEKILRDKLGRDDSFVLADYFDYIAGNSTGAIIAAGLSVGMKVEELRQLYLTQGNEMFSRDWLINRAKNTYSADNLRAILQKKFGASTTLGSDPDPANGVFGPKSLLLVVMRNATTDSPWPISNNPAAKYNDRALPDCNLNIPLWKLVRASTAAPTYFPPEVVEVGGTEFIFVDGGITVFNNPAFQLFSMATAEPYRLNWPAGEDKLLLVSIGTGAAPDSNPQLRVGDMSMLYSAQKIPAALMAAANRQQDFLCRMMGKCVFGHRIDSEIGTMVAPDPSAGPAKPKLFTYVRYNVDLTQNGLNALGLNNILATDVQKMDDVAHVGDMDTIGQVAGGRDVNETHFQGFV
jgi:predicted acylesterase/phospholipase RssA